MSLVPVRHNIHAREIEQPVAPPAMTGTNTWVELVAPAAELAQRIANTDFVPAEMRNKPAAVTACILFGAELGIGPMVSLSKIDVVKGRPAPRAELARALANAAGHELWIDKSTNTAVTVSGRRRNSDHVHTCTWTIDDAKRAGINGGNYQKYPRQMLLARASAELVRQMCPEVLGGITVFAEEAADIDNGDSTPVIDEATTTAPATTRRKRRPIEPPAAYDDELEPADETPPISEAQLKAMMAGFNDIGITDRTERLDYVVAVIGHPVNSSKELTRDEASTVIDRLRQVPIDNDTLPLLPDEDPN